MATLQTLRKRAGVLISIVIGLALFGFILTDFLSSSGGGGSSLEEPVAEFFGKSVPYGEYVNYRNTTENMYKLRIQNYTQEENPTLDEEEQKQISQFAWDLLINKYVFTEIYKDLGIDVSVDELNDLVQGQNIHPIIFRSQQFVNPQTGQFDRMIVNRYLNYIQQPGNEAMLAEWTYFMEEPIVQQRKMEKFSNLVTKSYYVPEIIAKDDFWSKNYSVDFNYLSKGYSEVADAAVSITEDEIEAYYDTHNYKYQNEESTRDIEYITFELLPSEADDIKAREKIENIKLKFKQAESDAQFVSLHTSPEYPFEKYYYKETQLRDTVDSIVFHADTGFVYGPVKKDYTYKLVKLSDIKYLPDSVRARHILVGYDQTAGSYTEAEETIDSLKTLVEEGADFAQLARENSIDSMANLEGGDLGWFYDLHNPDVDPQMGKTMVESFNDSCFFGNTGDLKIVNTQFGIHLVEITDQSPKHKKALLARIVREVAPSEETYQMYYDKASNFISESVDLETFRKKAQEYNLNIKIQNGMRISDRTIPGITNPVEIIKWTFNGEEGEIAQDIFEFPDKFVVVALTAVRKEGVRPLEHVKEEIETELLKQKKAEELIKEFNNYLSANANLEEIAGKMDTTVQEAFNITFSHFMLPGTGAEPKVIATAVTMPADKISEPIEGKNGVYIVEVTTIHEERIKDTIPDYEMSKKFIINDFTRTVSSRVMEALKKSADIKDFRINFL